MLLGPSLTVVKTEDLEAGLSSPIYIVVLMRSIHIVWVNPAQFGPSSIVQVVMAGRPGNSVDNCQNGQASKASNIGENDNPRESDALKVNAATDSAT